MHLWVCLITFNFSHEPLLQVHFQSLMCYCQVYEILTKMFCYKNIYYVWIKVHRWDNETCLHVSNPSHPFPPLSVCHHGTTISSSAACHVSVLSVCPMVLSFWLFPLYFGSLFLIHICIFHPFMCLPVWADYLVLALACLHILCEPLCF